MSFISENRELINQSSRGGRCLMQGPRPSPLKLSHSSSTIKKSSHHNIRNRSSKVVSPVVIYVRSPKIIHVGADEFMSLVQRLTRKESLSMDEQPPPSSWNVVGEDQSMAVPVDKRSLASGSVFDAEMSKLAFNGVEHGDQILQLSPTWLCFLACA